MSSLLDYSSLLSSPTSSSNYYITLSLPLDLKGTDSRLLTVLVSAKDRARAILPPYATSDWVDLAPYIIISLEDLVKALPSGKSLGEELPEVIQLDSKVRAPAPSSVPLPGLLLAVGPVTYTSFSGLLVSQPSLVNAASKSSARPTHPLPTAHYCKSTGSSPLLLSEALASSSPSVVEEALASSPPIITRSAKKKAAAIARHTNKEWITCSKCKGRKLRCDPPSGTGLAPNSCLNCAKHGWTYEPAQLRGEWYPFLPSCEY